mmetsp:Transcript_2958/g.4101  ORF Transcript_2958/g.4101 Transcript_2958/m.4101 type:complete len:264 (-) Transcript_2958:9813-10604(-)
MERVVAVLDLEKAVFFFRVVQQQTSHHITLGAEPPAGERLHPPKIQVLLVPCPQCVQGLGERRAGDASRFQIEVTDREPVDRVRDEVLGRRDAQHPLVVPGPLGLGVPEIQQRERFAEQVQVGAQRRQLCLVAQRQDVGVLVAVAHRKIVPGLPVVGLGDGFVVRVGFGDVDAVGRIDFGLRGVVGDFGLPGGVGAVHFSRFGVLVRLGRGEGTGQVVLGEDEVPEIPVAGVFPGLPLLHRSGGQRRRHRGRIERLSFALCVR